MENLIWFQSLNKPFLTPPNWVFTPVWTILYIMMGLSLIVFINGDGKIKKEKRAGVIFFMTQLVLNLLWSPTFFGQMNLLGGLIIIIFLNVFILLTIISFFRYSKLAAWLLVPYLLWVMFATYLNFQYYVLN